ncbi:MAG: DUF1501 domain-containing protein [Planctomycetaceae bacterium]|nr:DUF1501 domain-containing protein [Planctomycetaceae bacterium]
MNHGFEKRMSRRALLQSTATAGILASDMTLLDVLQQRLLAEEVRQQSKRVILLWLAGGASQLETWDPKPGRPTGGPFRAISTSVPGIHISELLPRMAQRLGDTAIIRSLNTKVADHGTGATIMTTGRVPEPGIDFPDLGATVAHELGRVDSKVPHYVSMYTATEGRRKGGPGFLGSRVGPMFLTDSLMPANLQRPEIITEIDHQDRAQLRGFLAAEFAKRHASPAVNSHNSAYDRVRGLMSSESLFDVSREPQALRDKYGPTQFGEQCLVARRLVEAGVPFVKVARAWWDSHGQNFETHQELCADLDHVMSALLDDLAERGLLEQTLVVTLSEFGRTPQINGSLGRDHFASAWSCTLSGCGIRGGSVYGKTDEDGRKVIEDEIWAGHLFATIFRAIGIDWKKEYMYGARPVPITDFHCAPIDEVLA